MPVPVERSGFVRRKQHCFGVTMRAVPITDIDRLNHTLVVGCRVDKKDSAVRISSTSHLKGNYHMRTLRPHTVVPLPDLYWISSEQLRLALGRSSYVWRKIDMPIFRTTSLRPSLVRTVLKMPGGVWTISPSGIPRWFRTLRRRRLGWSASNNISSRRLPRISGRGNPVRSSQREHRYEHQTRHAVSH